MAIRTTDILAIGLILLNIFIISFINGFTNQIINLIGTIGGIVIIIAEIVFLFQTYKK